MNSDIANAPGGYEVGSIFGEEDTVPLSSIADDMNQLVTSAGNSKENSQSENSNLDNLSSTYAANMSVQNAANILNSTSAGRRNMQYTDASNMNFTNSLGGQPISQMQSFDTMASRVSAPNLVSLSELSAHKSGVQVATA